MNAPEIEIEAEKLELESAPFEPMDVLETGTLAVASLEPLRAPGLAPSIGTAPHPSGLAELWRSLLRGDLHSITVERARPDAAGRDELARLRVPIGDYQYERAPARISELT